MSSWIFKQPNGLYGRYSTVVDAIIEYNGSREAFWEMLRDEGGTAHAESKLENADMEKGVDYDDYHEARKAPHRWNEAVINSIFRIKDDAPDPEAAGELVQIIIACGDDAERWRDEFAKEEVLEAETLGGIDIGTIPI